MQKTFVKSAFYTTSLSSCACLSVKVSCSDLLAQMYPYTGRLGRESLRNTLFAKGTRGTLEANVVAFNIFAQPLQKIAKKILKLLPTQGAICCISCQIPDLPMCCVSV
jgi:hypothetical protein